MCGIAGYLILDERSASGRHRIRVGQNRLERMVAALRHRGPDSRGTWTDPTEIVGLGHSRLAVLDLSPQGHQPMSSADGRWVLSYNGEIYNHETLRSELQSTGLEFRGQSDSEVLLESLARLGVTRTLDRLNGMFAFAAWDREDQTLWLCRDRLGIKPLYYGFADGTLFFGSELDGLIAGMDARPSINRSATASFLRHGYIPAPMTIYSEVFKLPPGSLLQVTPNHGLPSPRSWWHLDELITGCRTAARSTSIDNRIGQLKQAIHESVARRLVADVPVGLFLSGGIDSSLITAVASRQVSSPLRTFSVGFEDEALDESASARSVAEFLGTSHSEIVVTSRNALETVPQLATHWDEPFADPSQIPMLLVSRLARQSVTVVLSGDGGDEMFGGYTRYLRLLQLYRKLKKLPGWLRAAACPILERLSPWLSGRTAHRCELLSLFLRQQSGPHLYRAFHRHWISPETIVQNSECCDSWATRTEQSAGELPLLETMMRRDALHYLPDDILVKVDRASMSVGLEARVPLLDPEVVRAAWSLPVQQSRPKHWLKQIAFELIPRELLDRPKQGFGVPLGSWLRGPLRSWAEDLLSESRLESQQLLQTVPIRHFWTEHLAGRHDWSLYLWDVLMLQSWLDSRPPGSV